MAKLVTGTYGEALFELAIEEKKEKEMLEEVTLLSKLLKENQDFSDMMNHPKILKEEKIEALENVFKGRFSDELTGFLVLILQKDRYKDIDGILADFVSKMKEYLKIGIAYVTTAVSLKDSQKKEIEKKLLDTTSYETMEMHYAEDSSLIGGMLIRIGDRVVDSSIRTKLEHLTKELSNLQIS
jgi:F-type H+-transporting ATPase subunit delta